MAVFDFVVVVITTISLLPYIDLKVISTLRLLRAFRVVRIFGRLGSARRIIIALASSIGPVLNVLIVVTGMMSVFAMFGATAYSDAPRFYTFGDAMYTMFLTLCLDGWADLVQETEQYYPPSSAAMPPKLFFITYIFIIVFILMPVFVAAILDGYRTSAYQQTRADAKNRGEKAALEEHVPQFSYDAILHGGTPTQARVRACSCVRFSSDSDPFWPHRIAHVLQQAATGSQTSGDQVS